MSKNTQEVLFLFFMAALVMFIHYVEIIRPDRKRLGMPLWFPGFVLWRIKRKESRAIKDEISTLKDDTAWLKSFDVEPYRSNELPHKALVIGGMYDCHHKWNFVEHLKYNVDYDCETFEFYCRICKALCFITPKMFWGRPEYIFIKQMSVSMSRAALRSKP